MATACASRADDDARASQSALATCLVGDDGSQTMSPESECFDTSTDANWTIQSDQWFTYANGLDPARRENVGTYRFQVSAEGAYRLQAFVPPHGANTSSAPYTITHAKGTGFIARDQRQGGWIDLGIYPFHAGTAYSLELADAPSEPTSDLRRVVFGAVRAIRVRDTAATDCAADAPDVASCNAHAGRCAWYACANRCLVIGTPAQSACCSAHAADDSCTNDTAHDCSIQTCDDGRPLCASDDDGKEALCRRDIPSCPQAGRTPIVIEEDGACATRSDPPNLPEDEVRWRDFFGKGSHAGHSLALDTPPYWRSHDDPARRSKIDWSFSAAEDGLYAIAVWIPSRESVTAPEAAPVPKAAAKAHYSIRTDRVMKGGFTWQTNSYVNQERAQESGGWIPLITGVRFYAGERVTIELEDWQWKEPNAERRWVWADAMRVERSGD